MRALPSVPFSAVEPFKGDDQLGAALTRQIVPMIDIPEPSTDALSEEAALDAANEAITAAGDLGEPAVRDRIRSLHGQHRKYERFGSGSPETGANSEVGPEPFAQGDQLSGRSSAQKGPRAFQQIVC